MKSTKEVPSDVVITDPENVWMQTAEERKAILKDICLMIVNEFVDFSFPTEESFTTDDKVFQYAKQVLSLGLFYIEFSDAIREGDGERVLRCWRYMLPIFLGAGRTNYSTEALTMLFQYTYAMSPRLAEQLIWSRFVNVHGRPGKNIAADLHMEHLNRIAKDAIKGLGTNKTEKAVMRVGRAIGTIAPLLANFDEENCIATPSGVHHAPGSEKDRNTVVSELIKGKVFTLTTGRKHPSFPHPKSVLHSKKLEEVIAWTTNKLSARLNYISSKS